MFRQRLRSRLRAMASTTAPTSFLYVECDVPEGQTLSQWRSARERHNAAERARRGPLGLLRRSSR
jgi:hypothetical protein